MTRRPNNNNSRIPTVLLAIQEGIERNGYAPTLRQLARETGISLGAISHYIRSLEDQGIINRSSDRRRIITLTGKELS